MVYNRKYKHPKEELLSEGKRIVQSSRDSKFIFRVATVNLVLSGMKASELSQYCGVDERTISNWVAKVDEYGFESLMAVKQTGRPPRLNKEQKEEIKFVLQEDPENYGYHIWDGISLSDYIGKRYDVKYGVRACQKMMHGLGFSLIRPQTHPSINEPDEERRKIFKDELRKAYDDPDVVVIFQDEVHFNIQTTVTRRWAITGSEPKVGSYPGRQSVAYSGFVSPETGRLWVEKPEWFNYETTIASIRGFLESNPLPEGKRYCVVMDNAPWHKKALRLFRENPDEYADITSKAEFLSLPPYSPDLNPIEQVWRITRRECTHNRFFRGIEVLIEKLDTYFESLRHPNKKLHTLCEFEWMKQSPSPSS